MPPHTVDNLLCVSKKFCGNYHAGGGVQFADKSCYSCGSFDFCQEIEKLVRADSMYLYGNVTFTRDSVSANDDSNSLE